MTTRLVLSGDSVYAIDMSIIEKTMFEMMPMTIEPPKPEPGIFMRTYADFAPVIRTPAAAFLMTTICDPDPEPVYNFFFLFPLGRRAYVSRKPKR